MPQLSIAEAAKATGKDRSTIHRHVKNGRLSAIKNSLGHTVVNTSELLRVFGELKTDGQPTQTKETSENETVKVLRDELQTAKEREQWLRNQLETAQERIKQLEQRIPLALPERAGFFARFFKR